MKKVAADVARVSMSKIKCWQCEKETAKSALFCAECGSIMPPSDVDFFTKLCMPIDFEIGRKNLEVAYFALQRKLHPDLFINKSEKEKTLSLQQTMVLNEAFDTLKSPLKRAEYILNLQGILVNKDGQGIKPSQKILMESMEARQELSEANAEKKIEIERRTIENKMLCIADIKDQLCDKKFDKAAQSTIRLRYLEKLIEEVRR